MATNPSSEDAPDLLAGDRPRVSVALSMFDSARTIDAAIASLVAQTWPHWELLVCDDGSRDGSAARVEAWRDPRIRLIADGRRLGLPARLNQLIDAAGGRYLARMDADDIAYPERLEVQVRWLERHPDVDLVGAEMMVFEADGEPVGVHRTRATHEILCARPYAGFYLPHPTWMGRIEWFRRWRYDERFLKAQDQDLLRRSYAESRFAGIGQPLVGYRQDRVSLLKSWRGRLHTLRSLRALAARRHEPLRGIAACTMQIAKGLVDSAVIATRSEHVFLRHRAGKYSADDGQRWAEVRRAAFGDGR